MCLYVLSSVLWFSLRFPHTNDIWLISTSSLQKGACLIYVICVCLHIVVSKCILCCVLIASSVFSNVYLSVSLDCPFLIASSVFCNVYLSVSLDCPFLIASSVFSNVYLSVSLDCPFWLPLRYPLTFICQFLWIILFW